MARLLVDKGAAVGIRGGTRVVDDVVSGLACAQAASPNTIAAAINFLTIISFSRVILPIKMFSSSINQLFVDFSHLNFGIFVEK